MSTVITSVRVKSQLITFNVNGVQVLPQNASRMRLRIATKAFTAGTWISPDSVDGILGGFPIPGVPPMLDFDVTNDPNVVTAAWLGFAAGPVAITVTTIESFGYQEKDNAEPLTTLDSNDTQRRHTSPWVQPEAPFPSLFLGRSNRLFDIVRANRHRRRGY